MARLLMIRHGLTDVTGKRLTGRLPGFPLNERGQRQAAALADRLARVPIASVYASPLDRTWETAVTVASRHGLRPTARDELLDTDYGRWAGRTLASLRPLKAWRVGLAHPSRMRFPGGESLLGVQQRAVNLCEDLAGRHPRSTVALVTHSDLIRTALSHFLGQPLDLFERIGCSLASVAVLDLASGRSPRVVAINTNGEPGTWR